MPLRMLQRNHAAAQAKIRMSFRKSRTARKSWEEPLRRALEADWRFCKR
jgi:hypothetical protein